MMGAR